MNIEKKVVILVAITFLAMFLSYLYELPTIKNIIPALIFIFSIIIFGFFVYKILERKGRTESIKTSSEAVKYAEETFKNDYQRDVDIVLGSIVGGYSPSERGDKRFYGMLMSSFSERIAVVVQCSPKDLYFNESPSPEMLTNPFLIMPNANIHPVPQPIMPVGEEEKKPPAVVQRFESYKPQDDLDKIRDKKKD